MPPAASPRQQAGALGTGGLAPVRTEGAFRIHTPRTGVHHSTALWSSGPARGVGKSEEQRAGGGWPAHRPSVLTPRTQRTFLKRAAGAENSVPGCIAGSTSWGMMVKTWTNFLPRFPVSPRCPTLGAPWRRHQPPPHAPLTPRAKPVRQHSTSQPLSPLNLSSSRPTSTSSRTCLGRRIRVDPHGRQHEPVAVFTPGPGRSTCATGPCSIQRVADQMGAGWLVGLV